MGYCSWTWERRRATGAIIWSHRCSWITQLHNVATRQHPQHPLLSGSYTPHKFYINSLNNFSYKRPSIFSTINQFHKQWYIWQILRAWILHLHVQCCTHGCSIPWMVEWPITFCSRLIRTLTVDPPCLSISASACARLLDTTTLLPRFIDQTQAAAGSREVAIALPCYTQPLNAALTLFLAACA